MAVTILERPEGYILDPTRVDCVGADNAGDLIIGSGSHGLSDGDIIYLVTIVDEYNGFVEVDSPGANSFFVISLSTGQRIPYIKDVDNGDDDSHYFVSNLTHGWSAVHLPITYRLSSDLYPTNSVDTTRNVNSVQDANGYTVLQLSGSLGSGVNSYDFVKLTLPSDTELSGVYQILEFISPTVMIINLEYDTANNFTSATALKHYNNYNIIVRVYAGINATHAWALQKPYELAATLQFIPDDNNHAFFSINELLKSYIETRNNLTLGTLPNNIDFWTNFYIEIAESYDDSDGYVFGTYTSPFVSDQSTFEGTAVNAKLAFKNIYSGYLSEYLMTNNAAKFLTLFTIPVLFSCGTSTPDCYQDISFLNPYDDVNITVQKQFYLNGNAGALVQTSLGTQDSGVIRAELEADCNYNRVDISILEVVTDGIFSLQTSAADNTWNDVTYGEGLFVAVASSGAGNRVMTSPDGVVWTIRVSAADDNWFGVTYGNGVFVAVSISGTTMYSNDGITWALGSAAAVLNWQEVTYGNGIFVAVSSFGVGNRVMTSIDGINWNIQSAPDTGDWYSVVYGNNLFVAVGEGVDDVMTSPDGITWTIRVSPNGNYRSVTYGKGLYVAVGGSGACMKSYNGIDWVAITLPGGAVSWNAITFANGSFVAITGNSVAFSYDGQNWSSGSSIGGNGIAYGNGFFVIVRSSGTGDRAALSSSETDNQISETKQFLIDCGCANQEIRLTWLNNLGGMEPGWAFTAKADHIVEIQEAMVTKKNILPTWPKSYGADADTIRKQTLRVSNKAYTVRSQLITADQIDALAYIKSSVLVQIINSRTDRRTVIVDTDSFVIRKDGDKTHEIAFNISFTDDIPAQTT